MWSCEWEQLLLLLLLLLENRGPASPAQHLHSAGFSMKERPGFSLQQCELLQGNCYSAPTGSSDDLCRDCKLCCRPGVSLQRCTSAARKAPGCSVSSQE
jgi:hypothetical protein